jgi:hypothetical protein
MRAMFPRPAMLLEGRLEGVEAMSIQLEEFQRLAGEYTGSGTWIDTTATSARYVIRHTIAASTDGADVCFTHDFEDDTSIEARYRFENSTAPIFDVYAEDELVGHGYVEEGSLHYHILAGQAYVEVSYRKIGNELRIYGSSTRNKEGNYIVWLERLHVVQPDAEVQADPR